MERLYATASRHFDLVVRGVSSVEAIVRGARCPREEQDLTSLVHCCGFGSRAGRSGRSWQPRRGFGEDRRRRQVDQMSAR
jgi:hypothetical protein